jgi:branched-chain amino acid transport system permease protein
VIFSGIVVGCLYALAGMGLVIIFKVSEIVNFSQGDMTTVVMFVAYTLLVGLGVHPVWCLFIVMLFSIGLGLLIERGVVRYLYKKETLDIVIATLGIGLVINGICGWIWGFNVKNLPTLLREGGFGVGSMYFGYNDLSIVGIAAFLMVAFYLFFEKSRFGMIMRATCSNRQSARLMGVNISAVYAISWGIAGLLSAVAGLLISPITYLDIHSLGSFMIKAFAALVLGGFKSIFGVVVGGLVLGVTSNILAAYVSTELKSTYIFVLMILILVIRPSGLFGEISAKRV